MQKSNTRRGFTLIELLVVVLIIGILAAVALPQYQLAVAKSRFAAISPTINAIKQAEEAYYLANGEYTSVVANLDMGMSSDCELVGDTSLFVCGKDWRIDIINGSGLQADELRISVLYCPKGNNRAPACDEKYEYFYRTYFDHSNQPNVRTCYGRTNFGQQLCKTLVN